MPSPPPDARLGAGHSALPPATRGDPGAAPRRRRAWWQRFLRRVGPGLITGASDDDPSGIGTYAMAGAVLGYAPLWTALVTFPLMAAVQYICAKIGMVSGRGLAGVLRAHYPRWLLYPVVLALLAANTINAGVDLGAIAAGINLMVPALPIALLVVPVTVLILAVQVWGSYRLLARIFKWLTLALFAYIGSAFFARPDLAAVLRGTFVPDVRFDAAFLSLLVAILGTTISPYLFFWQSNLEVEEEKARGRKRLWKRRGATDTELHYAAWDVNLGMFFSNVVMYFIILASAATLNRNGVTNIASAAEAAEALRPLAGEWAQLLFTLGLVGAGLLAVPVLTTASAYAVCEGLGWRQGLNQKPGRARAFYAVIALSTVAGMLINYAGINPVRALFWTAVINGFLAPPLLVVIMLVANNRAVMGKRANGLTMNVLGWLTTVLMFAAAVGLVLTWGQ